MYIIPKVWVCDTPKTKMTGELHDLIIELRSLSQGVGTFEWEFDHLNELAGREANIVIEARKAAE